MITELALKVALAVRVALTMNGLDEDVAQLAAEAAPGGNPIANMPALSATPHKAACGTPLAFKTALKTMTRI